MAIEVKISLFEDLINLLKEIEHWNKTKKLKKLRKSYARIYVLMNELQDSNKNFLGWLKHSDDFNSKYYFLQALRVVPTIEQLTKQILTVVYSSFSSNSIAHFLSYENKEVYDAFTKFTGIKYQRIEFWKRLADEITYQTNQVVKLFATGDYKDTEPLIINIIQFKDETSDDMRFNRRPIVEYKECIVDEEFIKEQIKITENTINALDKLIADYKLFLRDRVDIEDFF